MLRILQGDALEQLPRLPAQSVQCCVTSPPYWGLRDYGTAQWEGGDPECGHVQIDRDYLTNGLGPNGNLPENNAAFKNKRTLYRDACLKCGARRIDSQLGLEATPEEYIANMVAVFREVWRVLRDDGTLWLNLGDSYASGGAQTTGYNEPDWIKSFGGKISGKCNGGPRKSVGISGLKPKDLCMMPARVAMALQADGWYLRSDIIWYKPNPMPESVTDRPTKAHEYIFLLTKNGGNPLIWRARDIGEWSYKPDLSQMIQISKDAPDNWNGSEFHTGKTLGHQGGQTSIKRSGIEEIPRWKGFDYFYDAEAIKERSTERERFGNSNGKAELNGDRNDGGRRDLTLTEFRNKRSVWTIATQPYAEAHFATFPEEIPKLCILAGSRVGDTVLDPFAGSGTVGKVALELGRRAILIELNPKYVQMIKDRTSVTIGMF